MRVGGLKSDAERKVVLASEDKKSVAKCKICKVPAVLLGCIPTQTYAAQ